ncbi:sodium-coupled monocarboxylate transporter [Plakobranchus ocellatus]|uniref:Sodium-coupled monocarboxylate transporter n=1 Tax=Plakobranchus ocellatus TaxID=259542 RepID=A0AAV3XVQ7_9GAST|nr:sodium-coupled monocarboxylate transporter [Plakobranchus ocellatus]
MANKFDSTFEWQDYLVFCVMLVVSLAIGLYFAWKNWRNKDASSDEMLTDISCTIWQLFLPHDTLSLTFLLTTRHLLNHLAAFLPHDILSFASLLTTRHLQHHLAAFLPHDILSFASLLITRHFLHHLAVFLPHDTLSLTFLLTTRHLLHHLATFPSSRYPQSNFPSNHKTSSAPSGSFSSSQYPQPGFPSNHKTSPAPSGSFSSLRYPHLAFLLTTRNLLHHLAAFLPHDILSFASLLTTRHLQHHLAILSFASLLTTRHLQHHLAAFLPHDTLSLAFLLTTRNLLHHLAAFLPHDTLSLAFLLTKKMKKKKKWFSIFKIFSKKTTRIHNASVHILYDASFTSGTTLLGIPAEVYSRGGEQWLWCIGLVPCFLIVAFCILPVFHRLQLTSAYEYLELRFNKVLRAMGSLAFMAIILTYMAAVLYAPAVALSQVTGLSREISVLAMGIVCTFYTSIGGIRAVVWTDVFQLMVVWAGLLALMFKGAHDVGGWGKVWDIADKGDRLPRFDMNPDPFVRHTFWTLLIGGCTNMMTVYGANQTNLQRYASVRTLRGARGALLMCLPLWICYLSILCLLGLVMYAYFVTCDPLTSDLVSKKDQLLPLFVLETMRSYPGLPGLFVASIFSASISTVSSGVNSLAAVTLEDVVRPIYKHKSIELTKRASTLITVVLGLLYGGLTIILAYLADVLGKTALSISFSVFGMVGGPLLGLIMNGIFIPWINSWGAGAGLLSSLVVCLYFGIDPVFNPPPKSDLPYRIDGCLIDNVTGTTAMDSLSSLMTTAGYGNSTIDSSDGGGSSHLYLSYLHYSTLAILVSMIVGGIVSLATGRNKNRDIDPILTLDYSCSSSPRSPTSYDFHGDNIPENHHSNGNLAKHNSLDDIDSYPYVNNGSIRKSQSTHQNSVYSNM